MRSVEPGGAVYVETSIVSYLTSRQSRDVVLAAHQQLTRRWWRGRTAYRQPIKEMGPGESDFTGPNVVRWHGAAPTQPLVHVAVGFGGDTKWLEKVTDEQYLGKAK